MWLMLLLYLVWFTCDRKLKKGNHHDAVCSLCEGGIKASLWVCDCIGNSDLQTGWKDSFLQPSWPIRESKLPWRRSKHGATGCRTKWLLFFFWLQQIAVMQDRHRCAFTHTRAHTRHKRQLLGCKYERERLRTLIFVDVCMCEQMCY